MSLATQVEAAAVSGIQLASAWLAEAMQRLVGVGAQSSAGSHREKQHSAPGEPPFVQTGAGQASIGMERTAKGARIGVGSIGDAVLGGNRMAMWDDLQGRLGVRRPWLHTWKRYLPEMDRIIKRELTMKLGRGPMG